MRKQLQILARQLASLPVPAHARQYSPEELDAMALAIVAYVEAPAQPGSLGLMSFQDADGTEWQQPSREQAIGHRLSECDAALSLYGKTGTMREHYAWAAAHVLERQLGDNQEAR